MKMQYILSNYSKLILILLLYIHNNMVDHDCNYIIHYNTIYYILYITITDYIIFKCQINILHWQNYKKCIVHLNVLF